MSCPSCGAAEPRFAWDSLEWVCPACDAVVEQAVYDYGQPPQALPDEVGGEHDRAGYAPMRAEDLGPGLITRSYYLDLGSTYDPYENTGTKGPMWAARKRRVEQPAYWTEQEKLRARFHREVLEGPYRDYIQSYPDAVVFKFERLYPEAMGHLRGVPQSYAVPAVLQLAAALRGAPVPLHRTMQEAADLGVDADRAHLRYVRTLVKIQGILGTSVSLLDLFPDALAVVQPHPDVVERAKRMLVPVQEDVTPKHLAVRAAASLYCAGKDLGLAPTQAELAEAFGISRPTLRNEINDICPDPA